jgi:glycolate oxidase iron-sulfur subunit
VAIEDRVRFVETEKLLSCVHCGLCLSSCPTYVELGSEPDSPRGRILLMRALEEGRLEPTRRVIAHLDGCLGCRACETACPSGVPYGELIEAARPFVERYRPLPSRVARTLLAGMLAQPVARALAFGPLRALSRAAWLARLAERLPDGARSWLAFAAAVPNRSSAPLPPVLEPEGEVRGTAVLLRGCVADTLFRPTTVAIARLLARAGVRVLTPRTQGCCGALAMHLGSAIQARALARNLVGAVGAIEADWVVSTAAGCGALLRDYDRLVGDDPRAERLARRAIDPLALLDQLGMPAPARTRRSRVAIHDPCHLIHGQGVDAAVRRLLGAVPGIELVPLPESDRCCGSAGTYNLTERAMAARLLERKLDCIEESGASVVAAANPGCLLQIRAGAIARGLRVEVEHPIDVLARAHGLDG